MIQRKWKVFLKTPDGENAAKIVTGDHMTIGPDGILVIWQVGFASSHDPARDGILDAFNRDTWLYVTKIREVDDGE